jgi:small-conductance mechanosensitive channel
VREMQAPLRERLRELARQGDTIVNQPDSQDPAVLAEQKSTLDALTNQFKVVAAAALPLSKEGILLDAYKKNLTNWRGSVQSQYSANLKSLLLRLLGLGAVVGLVLGIFEAWRRATFRYIQDARLRRQFLLLRRIALWFVIAIVVALSLGSQLGSLATFAGLMTAGVAVALQNVILAVVGYFLLIGKYGLRVGDRVQVSGVSGEVVEIGLIRLHVMEFAGTGADAQPTGRVVAFSNSVVFQPTAGVFRQVPGTSILWHEISFTLAADSDYRSVEQRMRTAVDAVFKDYHQDMERERQVMETNFNSVSIGPLTPSVRFRLTSAGLQVFVRFPVESRHAVEIDDRVSRGILAAIDKEPKLRVVEAEIPTIRLRTDTLEASAHPT